MPIPDLTDDRVGVPPPAMPPVRPEPEAGFWKQMAGLFRYLIQTEVHTYAFSVAACAILSFFPLIVMMYTLARHVFHSQEIWDVNGELVRFFLPTGQSLFIRNIARVISSQHGIQLFSIVMLLVSCTGVFLPLEVALNQVWGVVKSRSYLKNQLISFGLAGLMIVLAMTAVVINAGQRTLLAFLFFGHTDNIVFRFLAGSLLQFAVVIASIAMFFFTYWLLPNRKIPALAVLPTAIVTGLLWQAAKYLYIAVLPRLDLESSYGPFYISVGLIMWGYISGLLVLGGAHYSATRHTLRLAHQADVDEAAKKRSAG